MIRTAALIVGVLLTFASTATAELTQQDLDAVLPTAQKLWPASNCTDHEVVHLNDDSAIQAAYPGQTILGMANKPTCEIWTSAQIVDRFGLCNVLAHEIGHLTLTGTLEDHQQGGIMGDGKDPDCNAFIPPPPVVLQPIDVARAAWPGHECKLFKVLDPRIRVYNCGIRRWVVIRQRADATVASSAISRLERPQVLLAAQQTKSDCCRS